MLSWSGEDIRDTGRALAAFLLHDGVDEVRFAPEELGRIAVPAVLALRRRVLRRTGTQGAAVPPGDGGLLLRLVDEAHRADAPDLAELLLSTLRLWDGDGPGQPLTGTDDFEGVLARVAAAALQPGPDPDAPHTEDGVPVLVALARAALDATAARHAHRVAGAVRDWGLDEDELAPHLAPSQELRTRAAELVDGAEPAAAVVLGPLRDAVADALDHGDVDRAEAAVERLAQEHRRVEVTRRLREAGRVLDAGPDGAPSEHDEPGDLLRLHLRTAGMYASAGELDTAEQYLDVVERGLEPRPEPEPAPPPPPPAAVPEPAPVPAPADPVLRAAALLDRSSPGKGAALRATLDHTHRSRLWQELALELRAAGDAPGADAVFALGRPPLPPPGHRPPALPYAALPLVPLLDDPAGNGPVGASPGDTAAHFARAVAEGSPVALGWAVGWYVRAGDPGAGLELYRRHAHAQYFRAAAVWNIACAYAAVGDDGAALASLTVFARILPGAADPDQRAALADYCARLGHPSPLVAPAPVAAPGPPPAAGGPQGDPGDEPALAARAKELHEGGRTEEAVRLLDELLTANPSAPAAYLLMRIHRERGDLASAREVVRRIAAARGELSWRHHVELARVALDRRCTDLEVAGEQLAQARAGGAGPLWTQPLEERLARASERGPAELAAPTPAAGGPVRYGPRSTEPGVAQALLEGRLPELLEEARSGTPRPGRDLGTVFAHLRTMQLSVPPPGTLNLVIKAVMEVRDDFAARDLATWLMDNRYWDEAVEVLQSCVLWISPERLPRVLHLRDRAARAGGILEELNPPCPPVREDAGSPVRADRHDIQPHMSLIVEPEASLVAVWRAQNPPATATPNDRADLWIDAVHAHPVCLGNALGQLIIAGRPEDALRLHSTYADDLWLTAGAAWNLGCAYAATGRLTAAADTYLYQTRVTTRPFTARQQHELRALFDALGRSVPRPALRSAPVVRRAAPGIALPRPPRAALHVTEAESTAARLVAQCRNEPTTHHFRLAADAVRKAIRLDRAHQERHAATLRELFALQPPEPATAAALVMVLETAGLTAEAWALLARWIDDTAAHPELLGPAVRIARKVGTVRQVRDTLLRHLRPDVGFEHYLTLAKAAHELKDTTGRARYAQQALARNPSCAEAAYLLGPQSKRAKRAVQAAPGTVTLDASTPRTEAVALLTDAYRSTVGFLDRYALTRYRPTPGRTALLTALREHKRARLGRRAAPDELLADAADMIAAAEAEDWESAAAHARELVAERPWHAGIANAAAMCLIRLRDLPELTATEKEQVDGEIRGLSEMAGTLQVRLEILVQLAYARARYAEADALLTEAPRWWHNEDDIWAQAGLRAGTEMCGRPVEAAELLLEYGRLCPGPPGKRAAAVAVVLADRGGAPELTDAALAVYRRAVAGEGTPERLVTDALAADLPEVLNSVGAPVLPAAQIDRIAAHLKGDPFRLLSFMRRTSHHSRQKGPEQRRELVARRLHLFDVYVAAGRIGAGVVRLREAADHGASKAQVTAPLQQLCARHGEPDPSGRARNLLVQRDAPTERRPAPRAAADLAHEVKDTPLDVELPDRVARFTSVLAAGVDPLTGVVVRRLAGCWDRLTRLVLATARLAPAPDAPTAAGPGADPASVTALIARTAAALAESHHLAEDLLLRESPYLDCVVTVQTGLRAHWQRTAKQQLQQGAPLLAKPRATRIGDGPVEVVFELRTGQQQPRTAAVSCAGAAQEWEGHGLIAQDAKKGSLVVEAPAPTAEGAVERVTLALRWQFPDQGWSEPVRYEVEVEFLERRDTLRQRFTPKICTGKEMFVGRQREKEEIRGRFANAAHAPVGPLLITGSRRAGKTSLIEDLRRLHNPTTGALLEPADWPVPRLFPVLVSGQSAAHPVRNVLPLIAADAEYRLSRLYPHRGLARALELSQWTGAQAGLVTVFAAWWEQVRRDVWPDERVKPLVIIDECQELLRGYRDDNEAKRQATGALRDLSQRGEIALLFSGSCTYAQLQELLKGTPIGTDMPRPLPIGLLDPMAAMQVIHQGFHDDQDGFGVEVLDRSAITAYEATLGHPYHLHLLGEALAELLGERGRRVVDPGLVEEAVRGVVTGEGAVTGLLDQYDAQEKVPPLLFEVADRLKDSRHEGDVKAGWSNAKVDELADYIDLGLLRRKDASLAWVNPIVERWFDGGRHQESVEQDPQRAMLEREALQVLGTDQRGGHPVARVRDTHGQRYRGTFLSEGDPGATVDRFAEAARTVTALPRHWRACGRWLLQEDVGGRTFDRFLNPDEPVAPEQAVRWIVDACEALDAVHRGWGIPHGDVHPDHLALVDGEVRITGWGHSGTPDPARPGEVPHTWDSVYYGPQCEPGAPRTPQHDTVALAALLHQLLEPERRLPWTTDTATPDSATKVLVRGEVGMVLFAVLQEPRTPWITTPGALAEKLRGTLPAPPDPAAPAGTVTVINQNSATSRAEQRRARYTGPVGAVTGDGARIDVGSVGTPGPAADTEAPPGP
ncbi:tetratricopeptide repeat protein [Streptomyces sp. NPDC059816]|uniref:tetratricopeptide repeat protein n=1 Tax=Streptomyces sp. NPDC059816 TaxID=3346960 RepID=UPI0036471730